jgi:hypothetical protein
MLPALPSTTQCWHSILPCCPIHTHRRADLVQPCSTCMMPWLAHKYPNIGASKGTVPPLQHSRRCSCVRPPSSPAALHLGPWCIQHLLQAHAGGWPAPGGIVGHCTCLIDDPHLRSRAGQAAGESRAMEQHCRAMLTTISYVESALCRSCHVGSGAAAAASALAPSQLYANSMQTLCVIIMQRLSPQVIPQAQCETDACTHRAIQWQHSAASTSSPDTSKATRATQGPHSAPAQPAPCSSP